MEGMGFQRRLNSLEHFNVLFIYHSEHKSVNRVGVYIWSVNRVGVYI